MEQIGPYEFNLKQYRCGLCKYCEAQMIHSGLTPLFRHICLHPNLSKEDNKEIGKHDFTPVWCPVVNLTKE